MTIRNLDFMFKPQSVALIGASENANSVGGQVTRNVLSGGFGGEIYPVNLKHKRIFGHEAVSSVDKLQKAPDLAVIATPPDTVPGIIAELGRKGTKAAVVITAGFGEGDGAGKARRQAMLDAARPHLLRIVGPNCVGVMLPHIGLNASFAQAAPRKGGIGCLSQSGAVITSVLDWANASGVGFSQMVSMGNMADVDFGDMLDYLALDPMTKAIVLYVEAITNARKFMSAARAAARCKPVIVLKSGRHAEGAKAAASHTGSMTGSDDVYDAAFNRAGLLRVFQMDELFDAVESLAVARRPRNENLAILSNGGGLAVLATDTLIDLDGRLAELGGKTLSALDKVLPSTWSRGNPVDIIGDAPGKRYADALNILAADKDAGAILVMRCPTALASGIEVARAVVATDVAQSHCVLTSWLGEADAREARHLFTENRVPTFETPNQAVRAFMYLVRHKRTRQMLMETPPSAPTEFEPDKQRVESVLKAVFADRRELLTEPEAKDVLDAYRIPVGRTEIAATPEAAAETARQIGFPVALKILSRDISHKSDVGGVVLDLGDDPAVLQAAKAMLASVRKHDPKARIDGFTVQDMIRRPRAHELILGVSEDAQFGPVILFGAGGTATEVLADNALALPPLNMGLAHRLMADTRIHKLLVGYRDRPAAALDEIALVLIKMSQLIADFAEIAELDINPLLADEKGVIAVDARIRVTKRRDGAIPTARFAIRPYPSEEEETVALRDGRPVLLRPVRPEDEPMLHRAFERMTMDDIRLRFFAPMKRLSRELAARLTQIDYDREMALVLVDPGPSDKAEGYGVVRIAADPDFESAEFAITVRSDRTGMGIGMLLMSKIISYGERKGLKTIFGDVLADNRRMLGLGKKLGFSTEKLADEPHIVRIVKSL